MRRHITYRKILCVILTSTMFFSACAGREKESNLQTLQNETQNAQPENKEDTEESAAASKNERMQEKKPKVIETDWSKYFDGLYGTAVLYDAAVGQYQIFNRKAASARRSPCSTFKIISSLAALENGILNPQDSMRTWSGETFWNKDWNRDIDFYEAFRVSCVWYFRQLTDEVGREKMQQIVEQLRYGNCDLSDWEGRLNTNNQNRALTGFWIESSLAISPKEQVKVMKRIFADQSVYSKNTQNILKQAMRLNVHTDEDTDQYPIYGKTGMGVAQGKTIDAWYTGFMERPQGNVYFCVWLGQTDAKEISSAAAREIAVRILTR